MEQGLSIEQLRDMVSNLRKEGLNSQQIADELSLSQDTISWLLAAPSFQTVMRNPVENYVRPVFAASGGEIVGPGTPTSDSVPAMLSDGEFVFTAKAVRNAGGGDRREGAKKMYQVMKNLEKGGNLSMETRGVA